MFKEFMAWKKKKKKKKSCLLPLSIGMLNRGHIN